MPGIFHDFPIVTKRGPMFAAISTPEVLSEWWTKSASGDPTAVTVYQLGFGPGFDWRTRVTEVVPNEAFELQIIEADADWTGTHVQFELLPGSAANPVRFRHLGWPSNNEHYRTSCYCWAAHLRILPRYVELGEQVSYKKRVDVQSHRRRYS